MHLPPARQHANDTNTGLALQQHISIPMIFSNEISAANTKLRPPQQPDDSQTCLASGRLPTMHAIRLCQQNPEGRRRWSGCRLMTGLPPGSRLSAE